MGDYRDSPLGPGNLGIVNTGGFEFGEIETLGDSDIFQTQLISGLTYTIEQRGLATADGSLSDPFLYLVDVFDTPLTFNDDAGTGLNSLINYTATFTGAHYLRAEAYQDAGIGDYTVFVSAGRGTAGVDVVNGTNFADAVEALAGADIVNGNGGDDILYGGDGNDQVRGGIGNDYLNGGLNNDTMRGQGGNDLMTGGFDADIVIGGTGDDTFFYDFVLGSVPGAIDRFRAGDGGAAFDGAGNAVGDKFNLINIDANTTNGNPNDTFLFGGTSQTGKARVWLSNSGTDTIVHANTDNDAADEWQVAIEDGAGVNATTYTANDFFL